ncbi:MAG: InlB B-repeat-containing protein, partial [Eubacteriaceae bacterium]|nr:InlB B-repeat-containing protein [Eubacteriaceae bacterium]
FTFSGGEILAKAEGENDGSTGINLSNEILISGGKITATGTGELSSGISCYVYGGNDQVTFEISGGEVNCTATGSGSDGIYSNQTMLISGGTVDSKGSKHGIYCEAKLTIGNGIVKVSSEGGSDAIDTHSDYYTGSITLGNELTIQKPGGGRLSDDGKTINESGGKVAKNVEIVNANEYAVVVNETENGTVTSSRTKANGGEKVTLTVTAEENCRLTSISVKDSQGKDVPVNDSNEFTMPESDVTVEAVFTRYYAISIPDEAKDFISIEATESPAGEEVAVTLKDVEYYVIKGIKVTDSEGNEIEVKDNTFVMPASDVTVTAVTARLYTITFELNGGTLNGDPGPVTMVLEEGSVIVLEKPVKEGYTFKYWEGSVYYAGDEYEVSEDHELGAVWEKIRVPDTGDSDRIFLYVWLLAVSAAFAAAVIFHRRKADRI